MDQLDFLYLIGSLNFTCPLFTVYQDQIFFEVGRSGYRFSRAIQGQAGSIKQQGVLATHLIHINERDPILSCQ